MLLVIFSHFHFNLLLSGSLSKLFFTDYLFYICFLLLQITSQQEDKRSYRKWSKEEKLTLYSCYLSKLKAQEYYDKVSWVEISQTVNKTARQCFDQYLQLKKFLSRKNKTVGEILKIIFDSSGFKCLNPGELKEFNDNEIQRLEQFTGMQLSWLTEEDSHSTQLTSIRTVDSEYNYDLNIEKITRSLNYLVKNL